MRRHLLVILFCLMCLTPVLAQDQAVPRFEVGDCPFDVPAGQDVQCGDVVVPEDRSDPQNTDTIRLSVVVFDAGEDAEPDPVILLSGGPGEKTTANAGLSAGIFQSIAPNRDLILFDQRGVGESEPALECPEWGEAYLAYLSEPDPDAAVVNQYEALAECADRLVEQGHNLSAFNTVQNAADVNDIRIALGYDQVNLLGVSYGSVLAQSVMRDFPDMVRSAVIDSVLPLDASFFIDVATTSIDALTDVIEACSADEACNTAYPDLQNILFEVLNRLNADPIDITLTNPLTGRQVPARLTGDLVLGNLSFLLYQAPLIPQLPQIVYDLYNGDYALMSQLAGVTLVAVDALSRGMEYSVFCADDLIGRTPEELVQIVGALPEPYQGLADIETLVEYGQVGICANWPVEQSDPSVKQPLVSDIPTLVLAGQFDPVTPSHYARRVAENLSNSFVYEFPAIGHSVNTSSECARQITGQFLDDPATEPDTACLEALPPVQFVLPDTESAPITLTGYRNEALGISTLQPEGWEEVQPGILARMETGLDQTALVLQVVPGRTVDQFLELVQMQLGADAPPESTGMRESNGLTWSLYELVSQGLQVDLALAEGTGEVYMVQLVSGDPADRDMLYEEVFLPAVDAFQLVE